MGVSMSGGIFSGASPRSIARELAYQLKDTIALFLLCSASCLKIGLEAANQISLLRARIFVFDDNPALDSLNRLDLESSYWSSLIAPVNEGRAFQWEQISTLFFLPFRKLPSILT